MRKVIFILILLIVFVLVVFLVTRGNRDERQIRKNLGTLASLVEKGEKESIIQSGVQAKKIASFFLEDCRVEVGAPVPNIKGEQDLIAATTHIRQMVGNISVSFSDISITVEENRTRARSTLTAAATVSSSLVEKGEVLPRELEMNWEKVGREWKIKEIGAVETLH